MSKSKQNRIENTEKTLEIQHILKYKDNLSGIQTIYEEIINDSYDICDTIVLLSCNTAVNPGDSRIFTKVV